MRKIYTISAEDRKQRAKMCGERFKGKTPWNKGIPSAKRGELHYNWKGGLVSKQCAICEKQFFVPKNRIKTVVVCSNNCRGVIQSKTFAGENNPNFMHGLSKTKEYEAHYSRIKLDRKRGAIGTHTAEEWQEVKSFYGNICLCCKHTEPDIKLTRDHIIPLSKGGTNDISNIQPLCQPCNRRKFTATMDFRTTYKNIEILLK